MGFFEYHPTVFKILLASLLIFLCYENKIYTQESSKANIQNRIQKGNQENIVATLPQFKTKIKELEDYIQNSMKDWGCPGLGIVVVCDGEVVLKKAYGVKNVETMEPIDIHTQFHIASLTKNMFAHLLAKLDDAKIISLDDPVTKYIPDFFFLDDATTKDFKVRDLVSHRCGLHNFSGDSFWNLGFSQKEMQVALSKLPIKHTFRDRYTYQNNIFGLATIVVEKATGKKVDELLKLYIFDPLDMKDSTAKKSDESFFQKIISKIKNFFTNNGQNKATAHSTMNGKISPVPKNDLIYLFPGSTAIKTSVDDLEKWVLFLLGNGSYNGKQIISEKMFNEIRKPLAKAKDLKDDDMSFPKPYFEDVAYGIGWFSHKYSDIYPVFTHMGGVGGWRSILSIIPSKKFGFAIICNLGGMRESALPEVIRGKIMDLFLNLPQKDWNNILLTKFKSNESKFNTQRVMTKVQMPIAAQDLSDYEGKFKNDLYGDIKIKKENDKLILIYRGKNIPLKHWNANEFEFEGKELSPFYSEKDKGYLQFGDKEGKMDVCYISFMYEGENPLFKRVEK